MLTWCLLSYLLLGQTPPPAPVVIYAVGDIALVGNAERELSGHFEDAFALVKPILADRDLALCNLEAPLTRRGRAYADKEFTFRAPPEALPAIKDAGFNVFGLANNHMMDFGPVGLKDTLAALEGSQVYYAGAGPNLAAARRPAVVPLPERHSSAAVLSYAMTFPEEFFAGRLKPGTSPGNIAYVEEDVAAARKLAPIVVVAAHWGEELLQTPKDYQRETAHLAVEQGAALVVGHHPHVLQGVEFYRDGVIFYSLGNFAFGSYSRRCRTSIIARLEFSPEGKLQKVEAIPVWVYNPEVNFQPRPLSGPEGEAVARELRELSQPFGTRIEYDPASGRITLSRPLSQ
jgi:poly-gamma-glutamate synthesis protein (capsule biosynthesis protein)